MLYDTISPRYAHLNGLTQDEISLVMAIADTAIHQAQKEFEDTTKEGQSDDESSKLQAAAEVAMAPVDGAGGVHAGNVRGNDDGNLGQNFNEVR